MSSSSAKQFFAKTCVEALAVAIGNAHGFHNGTPGLHFERLPQIAGNDAVREAIQRGLVTLNIRTEFVAAFGKASQEAQDRPDFLYNLPKLLAEPRRPAMELLIEQNGAPRSPGIARPGC